MVDLTLQDHVKAVIEGYMCEVWPMGLSHIHCRAMAGRIAAHVQAVFIDAPHALPTDDVPGDLPVQTIIRHALHYIERTTPAEFKDDGEYRTVTDNLQARLSLKD